MGLVMVMVIMMAEMHTSTVNAEKNWAWWSQCRRRALLLVEYLKFTDNNNMALSPFPREKLNVEDSSDYICVGKEELCFRARIY